MKSLLAASALALAFAVPSLGAHAAEIRPITTQEFNAAQAAAHGDGEIADTLEWNAVVARANADRLAAEQGALQAKNATLSSGSIGTDGTPASVGTSRPSQGNAYWQTGHYHSALDVKQDR
jgi:hypothetical protein